MRHVRTLVVGNSVSGQKAGYVSTLGGMRPELGVEHSAHVCIGGVGSIGLLAFIDDLLAHTTADLVVVETSVMDAGGGTLFRDVPWAVYHLLRRLKAISSNIVALHLPRFDMKPEDIDVTVTAHNLILNGIGATVIDARGVITHGHTSDGVHLNEEGARVLAEFLAPDIARLLDRPSNVSFASGDPENARYLPVTAGEWTAPSAEHTRFRGTLPTMRLQAEATAHVQLGSGTALTVLCIAGPSSGVVEMRTSRGSVLLQLWDPWCEFRRIQVLHVPSEVRVQGWLTLQPTLAAEAQLDAVGKPSSRIHAGTALEIVGVVLRDGQEG